MKISVKIILIYILGGLLLLFTTIFAYSTFDELNKYSKFISEDLSPLKDHANYISQDSAKIYALIERESLGGKKADTETLQKLLNKIAVDSEFLNENLSNISHIKRSAEIKKNVNTVFSDVKSFNIASNLIINALEQSTGVGSQADIEFDELYDNIIEKLRLLSEDKEVQSSKLQQEIGDARYLLAHGHLLTAEILSGDEGEDFAEVSNSFSNALLRVKNLPHILKGTDQIIKDILQLTKLAQKRYDTMLNLREKKNGALKVFDSSFNNFTQDIANLTLLLKEEVQKQNKLFMTSKEKAQKTMFFISITAVITVVLIIFFLFKNIFVPLSTLTKAIENIKDSKLNEKIPGLGRKDEIGVMAKVLEDLKEVEAENTALNGVINAHSLISITDTKGKIIAANELFCEISQYSENELIGKDHRILNSGTHSKEFFKDLWDTIKAGRIWHGEICNKAKDDSLYWIDATITGYKNAHGIIEKFVAVRTDITETKAHEVKILEAMKSAEEANKAKSQFLANMSHEIRTPLNSIIGYSDILTEEDLPNDVKKMMTSVKSNSHTLLQLVNDILDLAKIESGEFQLDNTDSDLNEILFETAKSQVSKIGDKDLQINIDASSICPNVICDQLRMKQIVINLLGNAIKFTTQGEILISAEQISKNKEKQIISFKISDTGIGMTKEQCQNIFEAFKQADGSTSRKYGGTGLGLNITKKILEKMNSKINVLSKPGEGTEFNFTIEFINSNNEQSDTLDLDSLSEKCLLILDNNLNSRKILENYLSGKIKNTFFAETYKEAEVLLAEKHIDLFICDQMTFEKSSEMTLSDISAKYPSMELVALSSTIGQDIIKTFKDHLVNNYLIKPVRKSDLFSALTLIFNSEKPISKKVDAAVTEKAAKILVVDDNPSNLKLADKIFTKMGHSVIVANSGEEAIQTVDKEDFNIIFMDMQMPGLSGPETTIKLREAGLKTPIIALTANAFNTDREECLKAGMNDFTTKPLKRNELSAIIQKHSEF